MWGERLIPIIISNIFVLITQTSFIHNMEVTDTIIIKVMIYLIL